MSSRSHLRTFKVWRDNCGWLWFVSDRAVGCSAIGAAPSKAAAIRDASTRSSRRPSGQRGSFGASALVDDKVCHCLISRGREFTFIWRPWDCAWPATKQLALSIRNRNTRMAYARKQFLDCVSTYLPPTIVRKITQKGVRPLARQTSCEQKEQGSRGGSKLFITLKQALEEK